MGCQRRDARDGHPPAAITPTGAEDDRRDVAPGSVFRSHASPPERQSLPSAGGSAAKAMRAMPARLSKSIT
jgi:hypothetical protein